MAKQSSAATEPTAEDGAARAFERLVASRVGRFVGLVLGILGFGLGLAALGTGAFVASVGWLGLGSLGFAMAAVGREAVQPRA